MKNKPFLKLTRDEQANLIRPLMEAGGSYGTVAKKFGVKRGRIAGICRDHGIPSKNPPGFDTLPKSSSGEVLRLAGSEATQCKAKTKGHRCYFVRAEDSEYCALPQHQALGKRSGVS